MKREFQVSDARMSFQKHPFQFHQILVKSLKTKFLIEKRLKVLNREIATEEK